MSDAAAPAEQAPARLSETQRALLAQAIEAKVVARQAKVVAAKYPGLLSHEDLVTLGEDGLLEAVRTHDAGTGVPFPKHARYRVRGAMLDGVRGTIQQRNRDLELERVAALSLERIPDSFDPSRHDEVAAREILDTRAGELAAGMAAHLTQEPIPQPDEALDARETRARRDALVAAARAELTEEQRKILDLVHVQGLTLREAAKQLGMNHTTLWRREQEAVGRFQAIVKRLLALADRRQDGRAP